MDDGIFAQVILSIGHCFCTTAEGGVNHLIVHWSPILVVGYPFVKFFGGVPGLVILQALAVAATALPLYALARLYVDQRAAVALTAVSMLYPVLWAQAFTDFHENAFAPVFSATLAWALASKRVLLAAFAAGLLLLVKEDQFVFLAAIGAIVALQSAKGSHMRIFGFSLTSAAVAAGVLYFVVLRPLLNPAVPYNTLSIYDWSSTGSEPVADAVSQRIQYVFWAFLPLLFLPFTSRLILLAVPGFIEVLASRPTVYAIFNTHYSMVWSGYVLAAFVAAASHLMQSRRNFRMVIPVCAALACLANLKYHDPMSRWYYLYRGPDANDALLHRTLAAFPTNVAVSGSDMIFAHLGTWPLAIQGVRGEYYVTDSALSDPTWFSRDRAALATALKRGTYRIISQHNGITVAKRSSP